MSVLLYADDTKMIDIDILRALEHQQDLKRIAVQ